MEALLEVLLNLDNDLVGTGFDDDYVKMLQEMIAGAPDLDELEDEAGGPPTDEDFMGRVVLTLDPNTAQQWQAAVRQAFQAAFASGYVAVGFTRQDPSHPKYLLELSA